MGLTLLPEVSQKELVAWICKHQRCYQLVAVQV